MWIYLLIVLDNFAPTSKSWYSVIDEEDGGTAPVEIDQLSMCDGFWQCSESVRYWRFQYCMLTFLDSSEFEPSWPFTYVFYNTKNEET